MSDVRQELDRLLHEGGLIIAIEGAKRGDALSLAYLKAAKLRCPRLLAEVTARLEREASGSG